MRFATALALVLLCVVSATMSAQAVIRECGTHDHYLQQLQNDPKFADRRIEIEAQAAAYAANPVFEFQDVVQTIPVVVHVVYATTAQNISDAQIQSQIQVLNEDFRRTNPDAGSTSPMWQGVAADCEFQFCLAVRDPAGNPTNGITRTQTATTSFNTSNAVKSAATGGANPWPSGSYLNIWVCNLSSGLLGYATYPGGSAALDGVVCDYAYFGRFGTAVVPFHLGRTASHEVGHWLNLIHIWGDSSTCGVDDAVTDTPDSNAPTYNCPSSISAQCGNSVMFQNFMDYTDDACMNLFTTGQKNRMKSLFNVGGARAPLLSSLGCVPLNPQYQVNQPDASLDIENVIGTASNPAVTQKCVGSMTSLDIAGSNANLNLPFEVGITFSPLVPLNLGGIPFVGNQIINLNLAGAIFLSTLTSTAGLPPWTGNFSVSFSLPFPASVAFQMLAVSPSHAGGLAISQGAQVNSAAAGGFPSGPTADDSSVTIALGGSTCLSGISFFGTNYTNFHVISNGRVQFGGASGDTDFSPTVAEALADNPFVGFWTDLNPATGGTITITAPTAGSVRVNYNAVRYFGITATASFGIEFNTLTGNVLLDGLNGIQPATGAGASQFLGISRGAPSATNGGATLFSVGNSGVPANSSAMWYDFGAPPLLPSLNGTPLDRITFSPHVSTNYTWAGI